MLNVHVDIALLQSIRLNEWRQVSCVTKGTYVLSSCTKSLNVQPMNEGIGKSRVCSGSNDIVYVITYVRTYIRT